MRRAGSTRCGAALALIGFSAAAFGHGGKYQPPPVDRPDPPGKAPTKPEGPGPDLPPPPSGGSGPETTPRDPPLPPGGGGMGPQTPSTGTPPSPSAGGAPGAAPTPKHRSRGDGPHADHWTRWWYANRALLVDLHARVQDHVVTTPRVGDRTRSALWRAEAQKALTDALSDDDEDVASAAAVALGKAGDPADAPPLVAVLVDARRRQPVREGAALGLGFLAPEPASRDSEAARRALEAVAADAREPDRLRAFAVYALGLRGDPAGTPFLLDAAMSGGAKWDVAAAGASALGLSRCALTREDLERMVVGRNAQRAKDATRRVYAAHGLARLGDPASVDVLRGTALDGDDDVRRASLLAIGALGRADDRAVAELLTWSLRHDDDRACRNAAALGLGRVAPERAARELKWAYDEGDALEQPFAALGLGLLARRRTDPSLVAPLRRDLAERANVDLRGALCVAVGLARDVEATPILRRIAAERGDPELRTQAAAALGLLDDREGGEPILRTMLRETATPAMQREAALALGEMGDREAVRILLSLLGDGGLYVQGSAAIALGRIGGEEAGTALLAMLRDESRPKVARAMTAVALGLTLDPTEGRTLASIGADLDWYALTPTVREILDIL